MSEDICGRMEPETEATRMADEIRCGMLDASPSQLYDNAVNGRDYRHAMIHAGWIVKKGALDVPFTVCPGCGASLTREPVDRA